MKVDELQKIMHTLGLDYEAEANQIYVFVARPDGRVDNFSINVRVGRTMSDSEIVDFMRREYPAMRDGTVLAVDRSAMEKASGEASAGRSRHSQWMDIPDVCEMLKISRRTLRRWTEKGLFAQSRLGGRIYYDRAEIERVLDGNIVQENGRIDRVALGPVPMCQEAASAVESGQ